MGSSGPTTTTQQNKDPWAPSQPYLTDLMAQSKSLYDSGAGSQLWNGPTLAGLDPNTQAAMGSIAGTARSQMGTAGQPFGAALNGINSNGITPEMSGGLGVLGNVASGQNGINTGGMYGGMLDRSLTQNQGANGVMGSIAGRNPITTAGAYGQVARSAPGQNSDVMGGLGGLYGGMQRPSAADTYLTDMAKGGGVNPALQAMLDDNASRVANQVKSSFSGMGRYGSGEMTDQMVRSMAAANNPLLASAYESDQNRRLGATGQIDTARQGMTGLSSGILGQLAGVRNQNTATQLNALGGMTGAQGQNAGIRLNAAGGLADSQRADTGAGLGALGGLTGVQGANVANQTGAAGGLLSALQGAQGQAQGWAQLAPSLNALQYDPAQRLGGVGAFGDARSQAELDAAMQQFRQQQQMPWTMLGNYQNGISGLGGILQGMGGSSGTSQTKTPFNPLSLAPLALMAL